MDVGVRHCACTCVTPIVVGYIMCDIALEITM